MNSPLVRWLALALLAAALPAPARAQDGPLPADLAFVPADGLGFVHVRLADIWKSEHFREWRTTILQAGDQALAAFDKRFLPTPSSIDRLTVYVAAPSGPEQRQPNILVILATSKAIDQAAFLERTVTGATKQQAGGKIYYVEPKSKVGLYFVNERTLAFGPVEAMQAALAKPAARQGDLAVALRQAQEGKPLVVAVNASALTAMLPPGVLQQVPPPFQALTQAKLATLTADLAKNGQLDLRLVYADAQQADDADQAVKAGIQLAKGFIAKGRQELLAKVLGDGKPGTLENLPEAAAALAGLGGLNRLDEHLANLPLKKEGTALRLTLELPQGGAMMLSMGAVSTALLVPAVQKVREAAARTQDMNNLKQMALAMHFFHDAKKRLPSAAICDKAGKPLLSWRVAILPYIEQDNLYRQFKLDEPWDSEHNKKLIPLIPPQYVVPSAPPKVGETHYRVFVGGGALFGIDKNKYNLGNIPDGSSNTIMITETADTVVWTKPEDIKYDPKGPLPKFFHLHSGGIFLVAMADGSVRGISPKISERTLRAAITTDDGEVLGPDW